jgi:hypothetical protein
MVCFWEAGRHRGWQEAAKRIVAYPCIAEEVPGRLGRGGKAERCMEGKQQGTGEVWTAGASK